MALTCKKFNGLTLLRELGITNTQSYEHCKYMNYENSDVLFRYLGISVSEDKRLPSIS